MFKQLAIMAAVATIGLSQGAFAATPAAAPVHPHHAVVNKIATPVSSEVKTETAAVVKTDETVKADAAATAEVQAEAPKVKKHHKKHKAKVKAEAETEAQVKAEKDPATPETTAPAPAAN